MHPSGYLRATAHRWRIVLCTLTLGGVIGAGVSLLTPATYSTQVQFFVSTADARNSSQLAESGAFARARVKSYTQLISTAKVLDPVAQEVGNLSPGDLAKRITASAPPDTVMIDVRVTDRSAQQTRRIADALAQQLPRTVESLEQIPNDAVSPVKVTLVSAPRASVTQVSPKPLRNIALGLSLGLLLGIALAWMRERLDRRIRTKEDISRTTDHPVIGVIPDDSDSGQHGLIRSDSRSPSGEAFRRLRTNLRFRGSTPKPRVVLVTSPLAGEGTSTVAGNLAVALAETGESVVLVETDLRRPRLLGDLGVRHGTGLTDVLTRRAALADAVITLGAGRPSVLGGGHFAESPSELLGSSEMKDVLRDLASRFDCVILDAPPILDVTDAALLGATADGVVLVAAADGTTSAHQLDEALDDLAAVHATVIGVVVNRISPKSNNHSGFRPAARRET